MTPHNAPEIRAVGQGKAQTSPQPSRVDWLTTPSQLKGQVLERQGCPLHYWIAGKPDRPLVTMTHGASLDHRMFNAQVTALLPYYGVLVWDVRGHGLSRPTGEFRLNDCADDLLGILDQLKVEQTVLVGQSMGGWISQYAYLGKPKRVRAMVIIGATSIAVPYAKWETTSLKALLPLLGLWPYWHFARTVARNASLRPEVREYILQTLAHLDRKSFSVIWKAVALAIDERGIPNQRIEVPLLLTHGDRDNVGTIRKRARAWNVLEPDASYEVIPNASHNANQDNPDFFNQLILEFLLDRVP